VHATTSLSLSLSPTWRWACLRLDAQAVKEKGLSLYSMDEFKKLGAAKPAEAVPPSPEELCTIMYTSGTTGVRVCVRVCVCACVRASVHHHVHQWNKRCVWLWVQRCGPAHRHTELGVRTCCRLIPAAAVL